MAGADCVKFQLFRWEDVHLAPHTQDKRFEMPPEWIPDLAQEAADHDMDFACTPFAPWACDVIRPYVKFWKIGSFEALRKDIFLKTSDKMRAISLGRVREKDRHHLMRLYQCDCFLHCVSDYPTSQKDAALWRLRKLLNHRPYFKPDHDQPLPLVGLSDHSIGYEVVLVAVGMGVKLVEKHLQLHEQPQSPDSGPWSLKPDEFSDMVMKVRRVQDSMFERPFEMKEYFGRKEHWGERCV